MNTIFCFKSEKISSFSVHTHENQWEISLQLTGNMDVTIGENRYLLSEGDIRVVPPGVAHKGSSLTPSTDIYLHAKDLDFSDITIVHDYDGNIRKLFEILNRVMWEREINFQEIADCITDTICQYIKKYHNTDFKYDFAVNFKNLLYDNISNPDFNITQEIHNIGFNTDYFRRCFKEDFNKTPLEYLTDLRIDLAKKLLRQRTFQSVEKAALQCGYNDIYYFSKSFKKKTGLSPRAYRKKYFKL